MTHPHPTAGVATPSGRAVPLARDGEWLDHLLFKMALSWLLFPQDFVVHGSIETKEHWFQVAALVRLLSLRTDFRKRSARTSELTWHYHLTGVLSCGREKF